jgi:tetratricopeptide (TPR) repeat protein
MASDVESQVGAGFEAMTSGDWSGAHDAFVAVLAGAEVPEALLGLANTCYWLGDLPAMMQSLERAYTAARQRPDPVLAAAAALSLVGYHKQFVGNMAAARGWLARAARIVEAEAPELRGELLGGTAFVTDDPVESERLAREALAIGRANGNADLELLAMTAVGGALVQQGRTTEGMALLDEAMAVALGGEGGDPLTVAHASCMTMLVCSSHFDIERATQWLQAMDRFIDRYGCPFLYAECRTYYGRVLFENGDWDEAERFLTQAMSMSQGETRRHLEAALLAFVQAEIPYRAAQTRLSLAGLVRQSDPAVAAAEARTALTVFEDLGAGATPMRRPHCSGNSG